MANSDDNGSGKRQLTGALAATLGLVAIACSGDDDDGAATTGGKTSSGGSSTTGGKGGMTGGSGKGSTTAGKGGAATTADGGTGGGGPEPDNDIVPLNALLTAEYSAITAYSAGAMLIEGADAADPLYGLREVIVKIAVDIQAQHKLHAAALVDAIEALSGEPVVEADVAKAFQAPRALVDNPTIANVLKFAATAEREAAVAYNQVLAGLEAAKHRFIASAIEGDETQHFIVLAALVLGLAAPGKNLSLDTAEDVVPEAFVSKVGDVRGLDAAPADYFP
jgi:bacterioferritin (cytochrome b1)